VRSITEFGIFIRLTDDLDGLVHIGDLSWKEPGDKVIANYKKGQEVECAVLGVDIDRQRISLGIKQLESDPYEVFMDGASRGRKVEGKVISIGKGAAMIEVMEGVVARLALREVPRDDNELKVGETIEAKVIELDRKRRRIGLSISQLLRDEEKDAVRNYSQSVSGGKAMSALALELQSKLLSKQEKAPAKKTVAKSTAKKAVKGETVKKEARAEKKPAGKAEKNAVEKVTDKGTVKGTGEEGKKA
jgi:small subunit ribosomal protein S1